MENSGGVVLVYPARGQQDGGQENSLFQVIEKLSAIVERRRPRGCSISSRKRSRSPSGPTALTVKKPKKEDSWKVVERVESEDTGAKPGGEAGVPVMEKWYSQEPCGAYRCLICSYVCRHQRVLKTHAWKHAGLVRCSYPIFEDGPEAPPLFSPPEAGAASPVPAFFVAEEPTVELQVTVETDAGGKGCSDGLLFLGAGADLAGCLSLVVQGLPERAVTVALETGKGADPLSEEEEKEVETSQTSQASVAGEEVAASRRRTLSESLRLHSMAAEVLVAMPMTATKSAYTAKGDAFIPAEPSVPRTLSSSAHDLAGEGVAKSPAQVGISQSLLTVIEKLLERTDENASDEDVLRELRGHAPPESAPAETRPGGGRPSVHPLHRRGDATEARAERRPHRDVLHRLPTCQRAPLNREDPEGRLTSRCKTRMHCSERRHKGQPDRECLSSPSILPSSIPAYAEQGHGASLDCGRNLECPEETHTDTGRTCKLHSEKPQAQIRTHDLLARQPQSQESSQHGYGETVATAGPVMETMATADNSLEDKAAKQAFLGQRVHRCDVCDCTSSSHIGVQNHRRIPYRCCSCNFSTTNMNRLRSHMQRHPEEQPTEQLLEQYRCSLCGYACRHPPSLKSHMWKHAGDQNYNYQQATLAIDRAISLGCPAPPAAPQDGGFGFDPRRGAGEDGGGGASVGRGGTEAGPLAGGPPLTEYRVLLFCCCICGFEFLSRERLMEHMKAHQGEIVSITLSRDQLSAPPAGY